MQARARDDAVLDQVFWALSDATRRGVVERLVRGPATVSELAQDHAMSLPGFMKHLKLLEDAGLMVRSKAGRSVTCELAPAVLEDAAMWLARYEAFWTGKLDALGRYLYHQEEVNPPWPRNKKPTSARSASAATTPSRPKKSGGPGPKPKR